MSCGLTFIEKLEPRIAPAAVTLTDGVLSNVPANGDNVHNGNFGSNNPGYIVTPSFPLTVSFTPALEDIGNHTLSPAVVADLTKLPNLRVISDLAGMSGGANNVASLALTASMLNSGRLPLSELVSPLLQAGLPESISSASTLAVLGVDESAETGALAGAVQLLGDSNSSLISTSAGLDTSNF